MWRLQSSEKLWSQFLQNKTTWKLEIFDIGSVSFLLSIFLNFIDDVHPMCSIPSCLLKFEWYLALLQSTIVITTFSLQLCCNLCSVECARVNLVVHSLDWSYCFPVASKWEHQYKINILHHGWVFMPGWCEPWSSVPHSSAVQQTAWLQPSVMILQSHQQYYTLIAGITQNCITFSEICPLIQNGYECTRWDFPAD